MRTAERINAGALPTCLEGGDPDKYRAHSHAPTWTGFVAAIGGIMWVRCQGFERDGDAESAARDWSDDATAPTQPGVV